MMLIASVNTVEILLILAAVGHGEETEKPVYCDLRQTDLVGGENSDGKYDVRGDYRIRPSHTSHNPAHYKKRQGCLENRNPYHGPAEASIHCSYHKEETVIITCNTDGTFTLASALPPCHSGCDPKDLGGFDTPTASCRKGLMENGLEFEGNRCRRKCTVNQKVETARLVQCRCNTSGRKCQYFTKIRGKYRLFDKHLSAECQPDQPAPITTAFSQRQMSIPTSIPIPVNDPNPCGSEYMPSEVNSGCWTYNSDTDQCAISNPACFDLHCGEDRIIGYVRDDVFPASLLDDVLSNGQKITSACSSLNSITQSNWTMGFSFDIALGDCSMKTELMQEDGVEYIRFKQSFSVGENKPVLNFYCMYATQTVQSTDATVSIPNNGVQQIKSWDNFDLTFGRGNQLSIGDRIFSLVKWHADMHRTNVVWYLDTCTVISGRNTFDVIQDSCYSNLISANPSSNTIFARDNFAFGFESFSFNEPELSSGMTFRLDCKIRFCLSNRECHVNTDCPKYYHTPLL